MANGLLTFGAGTTAGSVMLYNGMTTMGQPVIEYYDVSLNAGGNSVASGVSDQYVGTDPVITIDLSMRRSEGDVVGHPVSDTSPSNFIPRIFSDILGTDVTSIFEEGISKIVELVQAGAFSSGNPWGINWQSGDLIKRAPLPREVPAEDGSLPENEMRIELLLQKIDPNNIPETEFRYEAAGKKDEKDGDGAIKDLNPSTRLNLLPRQTIEPLKPLTIQGIKIHGRQDHQAVVLYRDSLTLSDIPQLEEEFRRIRRDDLLLLHFLDIFHPIALQYNRYHELPPREKEVLVTELKRMGLNFSDPQGIRYFLSRILRFQGLRYADQGSYNPTEILCPLIACERAGMVHEQLNERASHVWEIDNIASLQDALEYLEKYTQLAPPEKERLAEAMLDMRRLFYETGPLFYRRVQSLPPLVIFRRENKFDLPKPFLENPSRFIEEQENVQEENEFALAGEFIYLNTNPSDITRIKKFTLGGVPVISKRIEPLRVYSIEDEIREARKIGRLLKAEGISNVRTAEYLGLVYDSGNYYILMRDEKAPSLFEKLNAEGREVFARVEGVLKNKHGDLEPRNALWNGKELVLIDFEKHTAIVDLKNIPPKGKAITNARLSRSRSIGDLKDVLARDPLIERFRIAINLSNPRMLRRLPSTAVIGDIHGNNRRLTELLESDAALKAKRTIFLGDYFDRGAGGKEVFEILRKRSPDDNIFLLGNHEYYFLLAMKGDIKSFGLWLESGGINFLDTLLDLSKFKEAYEAASKEFPDEIPSEIIEQIRQSEPGIIEELHKSVRENKLLWEIFGWLIENTRLFYIDEYGNLYIHAGIKDGEHLDLNYIELLEKDEKIFREALRINDPRHLDLALSYSRLFKPVLEIRAAEWLIDFPKDDWEKTRGYLFNLGIRGMVVGHNPYGRVINLFNRIFGIDLLMADYYGNYGGILEISPHAGIAVHRFLDPNSSNLVREEIVNSEEFLDDLQIDAAGLIRRFQMYFLKGI